MLVFATSDKGGTGRSVTAGNVAYRHALDGGDCCYLDFDFGSPTAGAIFELPGVLVGVPDGKGLHSHIVRGEPVPRAIDVWKESDRHELRERPAGAGRLVLYPGDQGGGEFRSEKNAVDRCVQLLLRVDEEFTLGIIDLSAGRSFATDIALQATAAPELANVDSRWLIFHRWTRQHIVAANGLVHGPQGILETAERLGHRRSSLRDTIRFVRTTVVQPDDLRLREEQLAWLETCEAQLDRLAESAGLGNGTRIADIPLDPVLQWQEQLLTDQDTGLYRTANTRTVEAFRGLAKRLVADEGVERL
ncbi:SCO2523 family variant P-loop protein [Actinoplanes sp. NPDC051475]|uniref:SCO2523 family variant P-loop protein n=1 Tax=Actinoplanes sp. NPDC051475 TaxID=3157225 RepID=UPI00344B6D3C